MGRKFTNGPVNAHLRLEYMPVNMDVLLHIAPE